MEFTRAKLWKNEVKWPLVLWAIALLALSVLLSVLSGNRFFFWDNVIQISAPANWYLDNNFSSLFVPDSIATGHPPTISLYIALCWKYFGKNLIVAHMAMLPFRFGVLYQLARLVTGRMGVNAGSFFLFILVIADSTIISQMSLVTFEIPALFFFLLCLNSILNNQKTLLLIGSLALPLVSIRGAISCSGLLLYSLVTVKEYTLRSYYNALKIYLPGIILFLLFLILFYAEKGWVVHNVNSDRWSTLVGFAGLKGLFYNIGIAFWRFIDFGRVGIVVLLGYLIIRHTRGRQTFTIEQKKLLQILFLQLLVLVPFTIPFVNPIGHRYFLHAIVLIIVIGGQWLILSVKKWWVVYFLFFALSMSGSFLIYPERVAQGWDSTAAHWPYYEVRNDLYKRIEHLNLGDTEIGTFYPNSESQMLIDLKESDLMIKRADMAYDKYIIYSNVFNADDYIIDELMDISKWTPIEVSRKRGVFMILFRRVRH